MAHVVPTKTGGLLIRFWRRLVGETGRIEYITGKNRHKPIKEITSIIEENLSYLDHKSISIFCQKTNSPEAYSPWDIFGWSSSSDILKCTPHWQLVQSSNFVCKNFSVHGTFQSISRLLFDLMQSNLTKFWYFSAFLWFLWFLAIFSFDP